MEKKKPPEPWLAIVSYKKIIEKFYFFITMTQN